MIILHIHLVCILSVIPLLPSYDEMGYYDLPAVIDYVLATTDHSNLAYVGHSMGETTSSCLPECFSFLFCAYFMNF